MVSRRNKKAGKHPSYKKRGMSEEAIKRKRERDKAIAARPEQKKRRAEANKARKKAKKRGTKLAGKDASHTSKGIVFKSTKSNRGSKSDSSGDRRSRGSKK